MKEKILEILNDENITDVNEKVDSIAKIIPLFTVPKDKYNSLSERLQNLETEKLTVEEQYKELQKQSMTAEQLQEAKLKELEEREAKIARTESENAVAKILSKNGITEDVLGEEDYRSILTDLIGSDQDDSVRKANNFVGIMARQKETVEKETTTKLLNETPKPVGGASNGNETVTKEEFNKMTYSEMMAFSKANPELYAEYSE